MFGLPESTEVKRALPKAQLYKKFELKQSQRDAFDKDIARLDFTHMISAQTLPVISAGEDVKAIFVVEVELKNSEYDANNIILVSKLIPQKIIFALRFKDQIQFAVFQTKLFSSTWLPVTVAELVLSGINLDMIWQNLVSSIGSFQVNDGNSLKEQIIEDDRKAKIKRQIETLEKQMRSTTQPRRQREIYAEIKKLKALYNG